jgi:hypothetical protein
MNWKQQLLGGIFFTLALSSCSHKSPNGETEKSEPPPCVDSVCHIQVEGYSQPVVVIIPPYADYKKVTLFLHDSLTGKERDHSIDAIMNDLEIVKAFKQSANNRIMIIPFSSGANADYKQNFHNRTELQAFLAHVYKTFGNTTMVEDLQIIAHGSASEIVQTLLKDHSKENQNLRISQIVLLDGTGAKFNVKTFISWVKESDNKLTIIYVKKSKYQEKALALWKSVSSEKLSAQGGFTLDEGHSVSVIPEVEFGRKPKAHWYLARKWFGRVL